MQNHAPEIAAVAVAGTAPASRAAAKPSRPDDDAPRRAVDVKAAAPR
jgi:hypothetical protein